MLETKLHDIDGRRVEINVAVERGEGVAPVDIKTKPLRRLFVGGLTSLTGDKELYSYFSQFGPITKAYIILDPNTNLSRSTYKPNQTSDMLSLTRSRPVKGPCANRNT